MKYDNEIQTGVKEELRWEPLLHADTIGVFVQAGEVILSGCVNEYRKKFTAQQAARRVKGVSKLVNDIRVVLPAKDKQSDADLTGNIVDTLSWHTSVPENSVHVQVDRGRVTLTGEVDLPYQAETAFHAIFHLKGIIDINDQLRVRQF